MAEYQDFVLADYIHLNTPVEAALIASGGASHGFTSHVKHLYKDTMLLPVPQAVLPLWEPSPGDILALSLGGENTGARFQAMVLRVQSKPTVSCWLVVSPQYREAFLRMRRHVRIPISTLVQMSWTDSAGEVKNLKAQSINLSGGGMRLMAQQELQAGQGLRVRFQPDTAQPPVELAATVVACQPSPYKVILDPHDRVIALRFLHESRLTEDRLVGICFRRELLAQKQLKEG